MLKPIITLISSILPFSLTLANPPKIGSPAPDLTATDQDGKTVQLSDFYKKGLTLIFFYPKAGTPGCTAQACSLRDSFADLQSEGLTIIGISSDSPEAQKKFRQNHNLPYTLLSDQDGSLAQAFGVPRVLGIAMRQSFLIKDGKIAWFTKNAKTGGHADEVRQAIRTLSAAN